MRKITIFRVASLLLLSLLSTNIYASTTSVAKENTAVQDKSPFYHKLESLENVVSIEKLESDFVDEKYLVGVKQLIDHTNPEVGTFTQRVIVTHRGYDKPVVLVCEGYGAGYALNPAYKEELTTTLEANQIFVEHRYFNESTPKERDWKYLTGKNSAADLHVVNMMFRELYSGKWISTGISNGGQNTMIYRTYYPDDVDFSVPYVGPVCFKINDGRHEPFLEVCGTEKEREILYNFQKEVLSRRETINPMLYSYLEEKKITPSFDKEKLLDFIVLEYTFLFWQYGSNIEDVPAVNSSDKVLFDYLMKLRLAEYFVVNSTMSYFVQAYYELGYYGYNIKPFKGLLHIKSAKDYIYEFFLPEDAKDIKFNKDLHKDIYSFLKKNDPKMIFIYGEIDPWSSVMPNPKLFKGKENMKLYIKERGSHKTKIASMDKEVRDEIWGTIHKWLEE